MNQVKFKDKVLEAYIRNILQCREDGITEERMGEIRYLDLDQDGISDITPLKYCTHVQHIRLPEGWSRRYDPAVFSELPELTQVTVRNPRASELQLLRQSTSLQAMNILYWGDCELSDLNDFKSLRRLDILNFTPYPLPCHFISQLSKLESLRLISACTEPEELSKLSSLKELKLPGTEQEEDAYLDRIRKLFDHTVAVEIEKKKGNFDEMVMNLHEQMIHDVAHEGQQPRVTCLGMKNQTSSWLCNVSVHDLLAQFSKDTAFNKAIADTLGSKEKMAIIINLINRECSLAELAEACGAAEDELRGPLDALLKDRFVMTSEKDAAVYYALNDDAGAGVLMILLGMYHIQNYAK